MEKVKVNLKSSCLIKPSQPTWIGSLPLSELDQIGSISYVSLIHLYNPLQKCSSTPPEAIFETFKNSLSKVLVPFHPLAGRLSRIAGGRLQIECNAMGVQLMEAESEATLHELTEFEHHLLVPSIGVTITTPIQQLPLVAVQLTRFKCGGICLGVAMSHAAVDGKSASHFYAEWARLARGELLHTEPFLYRKLLAGLGREPHFDAAPPRQQPVEFHAAPLLLDGRQKATVITRASLKLTKFQVETLKSKANKTRGPGDSNFTRYETITAHIWRCACKARRHRQEQQTRLAISVDIRRRMRPPLPQTYLGNAVLDVVALGCSGDLASKPLSYAASRIREAINRVTNEYVNATIHFLKGVDDLSSFQDWNNQSGLMCGNPNLGVASWLTLQFHGIDFGWGKEIYMGPVDYGGDGDCLIVPAGGDNYDGSVVVKVCLQEDHMEAFMKYFYDDMELIIHESSCSHYHHHSGGSHTNIDNSSLQIKAFKSTAIENLSAGLAVD